MAYDDIGTELETIESWEVEGMELESRSDGLATSMSSLRFGRSVEPMADVADRTASSLEPSCLDALSRHQESLYRTRSRQERIIVRDQESLLFARQDLSPRYEQIVRC